MPLALWQTAAPAAAEPAQTPEAGPGSKTGKAGMLAHAWFKGVSSQPSEQGIMYTIGTAREWVWLPECPLFLVGLRLNLGDQHCLHPGRTGRVKEPEPDLVAFWATSPPSGAHLQRLRWRVCHSCVLPWSVSRWASVGLAVPPQLPGPRGSTCGRVAISGGCL